MSTDIVNRMLERSDATETGCIQFKTTGRGGYGYISINNHLKLAHRVAYELNGGVIPQGYQIDHLCRNRACINPDHLEPVTPKENSIRGATGFATGRRNKSKTHCPKGHEYSTENTYTYIKNDKYVIRECRICRREATRRSLGC